MDVRRDIGGRNADLTAVNINALARSMEMNDAGLAGQRKRHNSIYCAGSGMFSALFLPTQNFICTSGRGLISTYTEGHKNLKE